MDLQNLNMMLPSLLGCPVSLKTPNMGNTGHRQLADPNRVSDGHHRPVAIAPGVLPRFQHRVRRRRLQPMPSLSRYDLRAIR